MSKKIAYGGILLALNTILLLFINVIPINTLFIMGVASLIISIVIMEWGPKSGVIFYIGTVILSFIVMTNKAQWVAYILTFGVYGLVKYFIEQDRQIYIEYILKLIFANIMIFILYLILKSFIQIPINIILVLAFEVVFLIYDYVYTSFIGYYNEKLKKLIKNI
ncbi:hypothetical protein [Romboutsia lituseburensis]|uniref:DUF2232 domain-containing protein n=1 Tax=Romboutsia lituseburensis DSM 797 TaxID=1121325 RepID=A0A1G9SGD0_9FIRM|nr:hypothetical protein [Romboutsia lituseburensis]CEH35855.1 Hypothetical protein RLITU_3288 [Romboutsia lituseburensis]SDM34556.1 hypothetical protein SAMN04515677_109111 [Romboutsia lituseburensis DSM 797]